jgi:hypothetical protein
MKSDFLHRFIHSLDKGELVSCKESSFLNEGKWQAQRTILFTALLNQKSQSETKINSAIFEPDYLAVISIEKNRMYKALLATVLDHRRRRENTNSPTDCFEESRLLLSLGLLEEAVQSAQEGIALAITSEDVITELALREHLRTVFKSMPRKPIENAINHNEYCLDMVGQKVQNLIQYTLISDRLGDYNMRFRVADRKNVRQAVDQLIANPLMADMKLAMSLPAQIKFAFSWAFYYSSIGNNANTAKYFELLLNLWESNPAYIAHLPHNYCEAISNYLGQLLLMGQTEQVPTLLRKMEQVPTAGRRSEMMTFCAIELQYQLYYLNTNQLELAIAREDKLLNGIKAFGKLMTESKKLALLYNMGVCHLLAGHVQLAKNYFIQIRDLGDLHSRLDLQGLARIWRLFLLLELDKDDRFAPFLRNSKRFFNANHPSYPMEETIYTWLKKYHATFHSAEGKSQLQSLCTELQQYEQKKILGAEELRLWASSRASGKSIRDLYAVSLH